MKPSIAVIINKLGSVEVVSNLDIDVVLFDMDESRCNADALILVETREGYVDDIEVSVDPDRVDHINADIENAEQPPWVREFTE